MRLIDDGELNMLKVRKSLYSSDQVETGRVDNGFVGTTGDG